MAKILVADDNSNIQKMVGLALKDQGIDVVAVGNGEAAVRKISDVRPDLVLADVFMPVRNGYEVCEYVKKDSALSHIPVILLVGAFDPLDEQEAQRVGADGVLKKPFVPPDPLISMVKSALARAGVSVGGAPVKAAEPEVLKATDLLIPRKEKEPEVPVLASIPAPAAEPEEFVAPVEEQSFVDEIPLPPAPIKFESNSQPLAFGSMLETPEAQEEDTNFIAPATPSIERDWNAKEEAEETEEEEETQKASWRRSDSEIPDDGTVAAKSQDWRDTALAQIPTRTDMRQAWQTTTETATFTEAAASHETVTAAVKEIAEEHVTEAAHVLPYSGAAWAAAIAAEQETAHIPEPEATTPVQAAEEIVREESSAVAAPAADTTTAETSSHETPSSVASESEKTSVTDGWLRGTPSPWEADAKKANQLASAWDAVVPSAPVVAEPGSATEQSFAAVEATVPAETVEEIREEVAQVTHESHGTQESPLAEESHYAQESSATETAHQPEAVTQEPVNTHVIATDAVATTTPAAIEPSMDELVAKVLAKMSPETLQAVTREILKPVIESIIRDELKKS